MTKTTQSPHFFHSKKFARYKLVLLINKRDLLELMDVTEILTVRRLGCGKVVLLCR